MAIKTFIVEVEGVISRPITIDAQNSVEAKKLARQAFSQAYGGHPETCATTNIYQEPEEFGRNRFE
jgi:hypothetical protein|tara:strand:- start:167 stop:364 length:198 start_codon:yes stop_codon:yes gene_type:complete